MWIPAQYVDNRQHTLLCIYSCDWVCRECVGDRYDAIERDAQHSVRIVPTACGRHGTYGQVDIALDCTGPVYAVMDRRQCRMQYHYVKVVNDAIFSSLPTAEHVQRAWHQFLLCWCATQMGMEDAPTEDDASLSMLGFIPIELITDVLAPWFGMASFYETNSHGQLLNEATLGANLVPHGYLRRRPFFSYPDLDLRALDQISTLCVNIDDANPRGTTVDDATIVAAFKRLVSFTAHESVIPSAFVFVVDGKMQALVYCRGYDYTGRAPLDKIRRVSMWVQTYEGATHPEVLRYYNALNAPRHPEDGVTSIAVAWIDLP